MKWKIRDSFFECTHLTYAKQNLTITHTVFTSKGSPCNAVEETGEHDNHTWNTIQWCIAEAKWQNDNLIIGKYINSLRAHRLSEQTGS